MNPNISNNNCPTCCANRREDRRIVDEGDDGDTYCADSWHATPTPPATSTVEWHKVKDGDEVIVGGRRIVFRVLPFRADPHPTPPAPDAAHPALIAAARERDALRERAEKAEALLREAAPLLYAMGFDRKAPEDILSRIDALLDAPTDADRRGEDREAIDAQGGSTPD